MGQKRKYDEGSIVKIAEGKYRLFVSAGKGKDRKRNRHSRTVEAEGGEQAEKLLKKFKREVERVELPAPRNTTFLQLWEIYLRDHVGVDDAPKTLEWYREKGKRLIPYFGLTRVTAISKDLIKEFYKFLADPNTAIEYEAESKPPGSLPQTKTLKGGLSREYIGHYKRALHAVFGYAIEELKIIKDNPVSKVAIPNNAKAIKKPPNRIADVDLPHFLRALAQEPLKWQAIIVLSLTAALRREEVAGTAWLDINFIRGTIFTSRAVQYIAGSGLLIGDTKTEKSTRESYLPDITLYILAAWKEEQQRKLQNRIEKLTALNLASNEVDAEIKRLSERLNNFESEFVFNQLNGQPMMPDSITKHMTRFREKNELPYITFHGLKHTSATLPLAAGADIKAVSRRLGHTDIKMTLNRYADALESSDKKIAKQWDVMLGWHGNGTGLEKYENQEITEK